MIKGQKARTAYSLARFGKTYTYIGDVLGVSRQRAHQMVKAQSKKFGALQRRKCSNKEVSKC